MATILVADDQQANRDLLVTLLGYHGHRLLEAHDGAEALELARAEPPDLVITDLVMPVMDGFDLTRALREHPATADVRVVFWSGNYLEGEARPLAEQLGVRHIMCKPVEPQTVLSTVRQALLETGPPPAGYNGDLEAARLSLLNSKLSDRVAELEAAHADLERNRRRLVRAEEIAHVGSWELDIAANEVYWSDEAWRLLGLEPGSDEASYELLLRHVHPEDQPLVTAAAERALQGASSAFDHRVVRSDGSERVLHARIEVEASADGRPLLLVGTVQDVTERKRAENASQRLAALVEASDDAIVGLTPGGKITSWNPGAERLYGYPAGTAIGSPVSMLLPAGDARRSVILEAGMGRRVTGHETQARTSDGRIVPISLTACPITDQAGTTVGISTVAQDITARRQAQTELEAARDDALAASRAKSRFLANLGHELRTPLNGVIGTAELLLDAVPTAEGRDLVRTISASAESLLAIVNDILDFSKAKTGRLSQRVSDIDLRDVTARVVALLSPAARLGGVGLSASVAPDVPPLLSGDAGRLEQVLTNLVGNAVKFTDRGEVEIRATLARGGDSEAVVRFEIRDTGRGIEPEDLDRIFDPFTQVDESSSRAQGGTGLGLAICRDLVGLLGGDIGVESEPGAGSTFWFTCPLVRPPPGSSEPSVSATGGRAASGRPGRACEVSGRRVLVADDNPVNRRVAVLLLERLGYPADAVESGQEAVDALARASYAALLVDCQMPGMDGPAATREIRRGEKAGTRMPIIAVSAAGQEGRALCLEAGMDDFLPKPLHAAALDGVLSRWIEVGDDAR